MKEQIKIFTQNLLNSAVSRKTEQGLLVFREVLKRLNHADSEEKVFALLQELNTALAGIEAHGFLTNEEFQWAKELRKLQEARL